MLAVCAPQSNPATIAFFHRERIHQRDSVGGQKAAAISIDGIDHRRFSFYIWRCGGMLDERLF